MLYGAQCSLLYFIRSIQIGFDRSRLFLHQPAAFFGKGGIKGCADHFSFSVRASCHGVVVVGGLTQLSNLDFP